MAKAAADAPTIKERWRDWSPDDQAKQPRRQCSTAGCKGVPTRVKETTTEGRSDTPTKRKHVYCAKHAPTA